MPKISVIIPVYNAEKFIERCVNSILYQTFKGIEIILVDDGSTDKSYEICKVIASNNNKVKAYTKKNGGASSARAFGVSKAQGEFINFVDADDTIPLSSYEGLLKHDKEFNLDIIQGAREFFPIGGGATYISGFKKEEIVDSVTYLRYLFQGYTNAGPVATLYKRGLFDTNTFNLPNDVKIGEDFYMNLCLGIKAQRIGLFNDVVYNYKENSNSSTHRYQFTTLQPQKHKMESIRRELNSAHLFELFETEFYRMCLGQIASACFHNHNLINDPYCKEIAISASKIDLGKQGTALRFMFQNPWSLPFFKIANVIRQYLS